MEWKLPSVKVRSIVYLRHSSRAPIIRTVYVIITGRALAGCLIRPDATKKPYHFMSWRMRLNAHQPPNNIKDHSDLFGSNCLCACTLFCTVWGPVSCHKRRKHVFRTSEGLQSAEINTDSSFSIQEKGVKLKAA